MFQGSCSNPLNLIAELVSFVCSFGGGGWGGDFRVMQRLLEGIFLNSIGAIYAKQDPE